MRILVAGGAGYIGSVLCPRLVERGYDVEVVDLLWFGNHLPPDIPIRRQDVLDITGEQLEGFDAVVFLAGVSNDPMADYSPSRNFVLNAAAPAYLAYMSKRVGVPRFVYGGSCSVYGYAADRLYDEDSPTISNYPYGISKLQGEFAALALQDESFSVIALRKGTVCGYSPRMRLDLVMNAMYRTAMQEGRIVVNNPAIWRPVLSVSDAAAAYIRALECEPGVSGVFNVAGGNYTIGEIADSMRDGLREFAGFEPRIEIRDVRDLRNYKVSLERADHILGFRPHHDVRAIVQDLAEHGEGFADFDNPAYYNIEVFRTLETGQGHV